MAVRRGEVFTFPETGAGLAPLPPAPPLGEGGGEFQGRGKAVELGRRRGGGADRRRPRGLGEAQQGEQVGAYRRDRISALRLALRLLRRFQLARRILRERFDARPVRRLVRIETEAMDRILEGKTVGDAAAAGELARAA